MTLPAATLPQAGTQFRLCCDSEDARGARGLWGWLIKVHRESVSVEKLRPKTRGVTQVVRVRVPACNGRII